MAMDTSDRRGGSLSGLSEGEAREFHRVFMSSFTIFLIVAIVAHILAWMWRPWLPSIQVGRSSSVSKSPSLQVSGRGFTRAIWTSQVKPE